MPNPVLDQERVEFLRARAQTRHELLPAWPRPDKELPVVQVEVDWVRFSTLNHRTRAEQLQAIHLSGRTDLFTADPLGTDAQAAQYKILCAQKGFEDLKRDLLERRQQEPAVVSAEGILINGNRRVAALRSLYHDEHCLDARYVRCLLLPEDATGEELVDLEAELQIAKDFKEEYTWVNEAMLIEELYEREGRDFAHVSRKMHRDEKGVRALYEKLQQLHQLVALSKGTKLHVDFVDNESAFDELAKHVKNKAREEQDSVRSSYFLGTLAGVNYRTLRHLRRPDAADLVLGELERNPGVRPLLSALTTSEATRVDSAKDPLDDLLGDNDAPPSGAKRLMGVLGYLASKREEQSVPLVNGDSAVVNDLLASVQSAVEAAAAEAEEQSKDDAAVHAPIARLQEAAVKVDRAGEMLSRARSLPDWNEQEFQSMAEEVLSKLAILKSSPL